MINVFNEVGDAWIGFNSDLEFLEWLEATGHLRIATYPQAVGQSDVIVEDLTSKTTLRNRIGYYRDLLREVASADLDYADALAATIKDVIENEGEDDHIPDEGDVIDGVFVLNGGAP